MEQRGGAQGYGGTQQWGGPGLLVGGGRRGSPVGHATMAMGQGLDLGGGATARCVDFDSIRACHHMPSRECVFWL